MMEPRDGLGEGLARVRFQDGIVGIGGSHAQVTSTRPKSGSASLPKTEIGTSMSVGWHPTPGLIRHQHLR